MAGFPGTLAIRYTQKQLLKFRFLFSSSLTRSRSKILECGIITPDTSLVSPTSFPTEFVTVMVETGEDFFRDVAIRKEKKSEEEEEGTM